MGRRRLRIAQTRDSAKAARHAGVVAPKGIGGGSGIEETDVRHAGDPGRCRWLFN